MGRRLVFPTAAITAATMCLAGLPGGAFAKPPAPIHRRAKVHHTRPKAAPAKGRATLYIYDAFRVHRRTVDVPGRAFHLTGYVRPYVPHQKVTLTAYLGKRRISRHELNVHATKGRAGRFVGTVTAPRAGILHLKVSHSRSPKLQGFHAGRGVEILPESTQSKLFTALVQQRLAKLHLYMPQSGVWDLQTELAIEAYHRLVGRGTSTVLDSPTLADLLDGKGTFAVQYPHNGRHAEGDLSDQLVALIDGSQVERIYPISSGKPSTPTILGNYQVYERVPGYLPDGMYYSDFFIRGYAIHGYDPAPDYPASHGCMRLPISDAISAFDWLAIGDWVDVYGAPDGSV
jgi:hypothetical protein